MKLNVENVAKPTENWRQLDLIDGDDELTSRLLIGDLGANRSFYHKLCSNKLYNKVAQKDKERKQTRVDVK